MYLWDVPSNKGLARENQNLEIAREIQNLEIAIKIAPTKGYL